MSFAKDGISEVPARVGKNGPLRHEISNREALIRDSGSEEEYQSRRGRLEVIKRDRY
jgi:hypothetical protein